MHEVSERNTQHTGIVSKLFIAETFPQQEQRKCSSKYVDLPYSSVHQL